MRWLTFKHDCFYEKYTIFFHNNVKWNCDSNQHLIMIPNPSIQWICWVHGKEKAKEVVGPPSGRGVLRECFPGRFWYHLTCSKFWVLDICDSSKKIGLFHKTQAIIYLDVVKSRVQADDPSKPLYKGTLDCVRQSYKRYQFIITDNLSASIALNAAIRNLRLLESIS